MENIKIAHLYYDLMNLYGEHGNIRALKKHIEAQKIKVKIDYLSIDDKIDFNKYDVFYIGSGNKDAFKIVLDDILTRKEDIKKAFKNNKFFIITGNALNFFGNTYHTLNDIHIKTLNIFNFEAFETPFRIVGEQIYQFSKLKEDIIGFQNRNSVLKFIKEPHLFEIKKGTGYVPKATAEGICKKNFYGTYMLGPILIRNPHFTEYLTKEILKSKKLPYKYFKDEDELKAYQEYIKNNLHE